jgi:hypothetical protein
MHYDHGMKPSWVKSTTTTTVTPPATPPPNSNGKFFKNCSNQFELIRHSFFTDVIHDIASWITVLSAVIFCFILCGVWFWLKCLPWLKSFCNRFPCRMELVINIERGQPTLQRIESSGEALKDVGLG